MWKKQGLICKPNNTWWNKTHCYCPTPFVMDDCVRVYYSVWDKNNRGRITYIDLDKLDPSIVLYKHTGFVLDIGQIGLFDCDGVGPSYVLRMVDNTIILYYYGFQRTSNVNATLVLAGCAVSYDNGVTFKRMFLSPILERSHSEPDLRSSVSILKENDKYKIWYTASISGWTETIGSLFSKDKYPNYSIRYLETNNNLEFGDSGKVCLKLEGDEFALGRPWVIKENGIYKMWYSRRGVSQLYRFGYAESNNGVSWTRMDDKIDIDMSKSGWDSEMVCFPAIFDTNKRYMVYNGNNHGKDGFGLAVWED